MDQSPRASPRSRHRWARRWLRIGWLVPLGALFAALGVLLLTYAFAAIPLPDDVPLAQAAKVYDRNGELLGTFSGEERRFVINTERLPKHVGQAVIAAEDKDFYEHNGVSLRGIARAAFQDIRGGAITQGGSTLSQQYVKNAVLRDPSRTIERKLKEVVLAVKLERRYSKKEILGFYLNTIYLGRGAYGIEAAANAYFDKPATQLTLEESALLASIIPAPESYQPDENPRLVRRRRNLVLGTMAEEGFIDRAEAREAKRSKLEVIRNDPAASRQQQAAYFMEWLRREYLEPEYGAELYTAGLKIHTTLDLDMQNAAEEAVASQLTEPDDPQASLVSMTPTGEVWAFVGGRDFTNVRKARGTIYAADEPGHQAGSALKPFTLLTAIEQGISPDSRFSGKSPATIEAPECAGPDGLWEPENFGGTSYGTLTLDQATTNSVNTVFAQLAPIVGPERIQATLEEFGFAPNLGAEEIPANCSLALGAYPVTPIEMGRAYAGFANRGALPEVIPVRYIETSEGDCLISYVPLKQKCEEEKNTKPEQVVDQNSADVLTQTLTHVVSSGTATAADIGRPVAGKTGTAQDNVASWFSGYVPQLETVVWMGYPLEKGPDGNFGLNKKTGTVDDFVPRMGYCSDPLEWPAAYAAKVDLCRPVHGIEVTGGSFPAQIWAEYMRVATAGMEVESFPIPSDMPDEIINSPAPEPSPTHSPKPTPTDKATPKPKPTPTVVPTPTVEPSPSPSVSPPTGGDPGGGGAGGGSGGGRGGSGGTGFPGEPAAARAVAVAWWQLFAWVYS